MFSDLLDCSVIQRRVAFSLTWESATPSGLQDKCKVILCLQLANIYISNNIRDPLEEKPRTISLISVFNIVCDSISQSNYLLLVTCFAGSLPIREHIRRQGSTLQWLLERCGNRYQVMADQSRASEFQVRELFEKILKMMEAQRRPLEVQQRKYTQLRREVSMKQESRWQGRPVEIEMSMMDEEIDERPRRTNQVESGWPYIPRGRFL